MARAAWMFLFWIMAAVLVAAAPQALGFASPIVAMAIKVAVIVAVAFAYVKVGRGPESLNGALMVGALWLLLDVIAEMTVATRLGRSWFELIGSPTHRLCARVSCWRGLRRPHCLCAPTALSRHPAQS